MAADHTPPLECLSVFHSRDADEVGGFLGNIGFDLTVRGRGAQGLVDTRMNGAYFPSLWMGYTQYGSAVRVETQTRPDFWIQMPLRGGIEATYGHEVVSCGQSTAAVTSPLRERVILADAASARLQLSLIGPALERQLAALLGDWPRTPLELAPAMDLGHGYGLSIARLVEMAIAEFEQAGRVPWTAVTITQFEQLIMTRLLLEHPHTHSAALHRHERLISPRGVKRVVDFIHAHLDQPITVADLVAVSGIPGRTLFEHFRDFKGVPPMRYLRQQRLSEARRALMTATPMDNVTGVALRFGFSHLGRFAGEYRRRFGESPSTTLAGGRRGAYDARYLQAMQAQRQLSVLQ